MVGVREDQLEESAFEGELAYPRTTSYAYPPKALLTPFCGLICLPNLLPSCTKTRK